MREKREAIHRKYDEYFAALARLEHGELSARERLQQLNKLSEALQDWGTAVFHDESFDWYLHYKEHGTLPYPGALIDQPRYVRHDLTHWMMLEQWHRINERLPSADGLPTLEDLVQSSEKGD